MHLIAFLTEPRAIRVILAHLGEPTIPPPLAPHARVPPELETESASKPASGAPDNCARPASSL